MFAIDLAAVVLLWRAVQAVPLQKSFGVLDLRLLGPVYVVLALSALGFMVLSQPARLAGNEFIDESAELVILEPEEWVGKAFPLSEHLSPPIDIQSGVQIILMYHHDCPDCQEVLPAYIERAELSELGGQESGVALVEIPPSGPPRDYGQAVHTCLSGEKEWFVEAPVEIQLSDGIVIGVRRDLISE